MVSKMLQGGTPICYGARAISEGGFQSIPKLVFPGGALIGDTAGFLNVPKIKGSHTAIKSGILAAEAAFEELEKYDGKPIDMQEYPSLNVILAFLFCTEKLKNSWLYQELYKVRNIRPGFHKGLIPGVVHAAIDTFVFFGNAPWTLHNHADHSALKPAKECKEIEYPKPGRFYKSHTLSVA